MANETPNRVHAGGLFVPTDPIVEPFTTAIVNSQAIQSFQRLATGQYLITLQRTLAFSEGYAEASLPPNFQGIAGAQISEDGATVLVSVLTLGTGIPVDPPIVSLTVWSVREGEGEGPAIGFPAIPPPLPSGGGGEFRQAFVNGDLAAGVLTVTHNLGERYHSVTLYNNSDQMIMADQITDVDTNTVTVDLSSFGAIAGTWNVVVGG